MTSSVAPEPVTRILMRDLELFLRLPPVLDLQRQARRNAQQHLVVMADNRHDLRPAQEVWAALQQQPSVGRPEMAVTAAPKAQLDGAVDTLTAAQKEKADADVLAALQAREKATRDAERAVH